jgi:hypothetical protein
VLNYLRPRFVRPRFVFPLLTTICVPVAFPGNEGRDVPAVVGVWLACVLPLLLRMRALGKTQRQGWLMFLLGFHVFFFHLHTFDA